MPMRMRPDTVTSAADTAAGTASPQVSARRHRPPRTSPNWQPHQSSREGWDFNPNTSTDSLPGTGRIIRRFRFQDSASGDRPLEKRLPQISFFDVKMDPKSLSPRAQNGATDKRNPPAIIPSKRDYLRVYYSDFLGQEERSRRTDHSLLIPRARLASRATSFRIGSCKSSQERGPRCIRCTC